MAQAQSSDSVASANAAKSYYPSTLLRMCKRALAEPNAARRRRLTRSTTGRRAGLARDPRNPARCAAMTSTPTRGIDRPHRRVIFASSLGTVFEWYDFYLYGSLAAVISKQFFSGVNETTASSSPCWPSPPGSRCGRSARSCSAASGTWSDAVHLPDHDRDHGLSTAIVGLLPGTRRSASPHRSYW